MFSVNDYLFKNTMWILMKYFENKKILRTKMYNFSIKLIYGITHSKNFY